ncbi:hypothetical protein MHO82_12960 [Vibrio sp. Of7-15]|uniref:hypothetical protein n=1 Tax=Vibrio sp. Of7-15 TaxID=2724879 RepID=UPI001EF39B00|nr:hypothetical protein [Vibrio sp. Of7-15]MCG7497774.1 hypothetical protein [Vibrio sp. Of7-15]
MDKSEQEVALNTRDEFYIVSPKKFIIMFFGTLGMYHFYWFYKNWSNYRNKTGDKVWPIARSIFSVFFTHSLFKKMLGKHSNPTSEMSKMVDVWALVYVLTYVVSQISDQLPGKEIGFQYTDYISFILLPAACWSLYKAQVLANAVCNNPDGSKNNKFSILNYLWLVLGAVFWSLIVWGMTL